MQSGNFRFARSALIGWAAVGLTFMVHACASVGRSKSALAGANSVLNQSGSGRAASPRHTLREWRLELDTGGFVQLILSSSGHYLMRYGYSQADQTIGSDKTLMVSEVNIGKYGIHGSKVSVGVPLKSTCLPRIGQDSHLILESGLAQSLLMDEFATRNFIFEAIKEEMELPFLKQSLGSLDEKSALPTEEGDPDGNLETKLGCVQMQANGQIGFALPEAVLDEGAPQSPSLGVAH